ncbi:unnamed protein product [Tilletia controversa]|nr:unnamed protein product [Tilletia controversa]
MLIGKTQDKQEGDAVHQDDVAQQEEAPGALSEEEKIILPCISSILFARNRLLNRFQMLVGVLLAVSDTPDMVKGFLHHCGMTVSQPTIRSTLESISDMAVPNAKELFADKNRIKVFLFDNINIYMRRAALRLTDFNTAAALTMRTIYTLSSASLPSDFNEGHIRQLRDADRALLTVEDIVPDGNFLEQAGIIHIAQSLMGCAQFQPRQQSAVLRRLEELRRLHTIDVLEPEVTTFVSLKLLREDEGTLEGIKTVFTDTLQELGLDATMEPLLVAGDLLSTHFAASKSGKDGCLYRVREILRRGRTALREDKPLFNEGWEFGQEVWEGRLQAMLDTERNVDPRRPANAWSPGTKDFFRMCERLYKKFFTAQATERARDAGDEVHAVVCCFMRDWVIGVEFEAATKAGDIGRLRAAQLVNRRGAPGEFEGADHYQETLNKEVQRADTSRSSHHVLDRLEDRLSAVAEQARVVKESIAKGWNVPLFHRNKTTKADQIDIAQIKRVSVDTHLFTIVAGRTIGPSSRAEEGGATARKETAKAAARKDAEHEVGSFQLADPLMRGYVKLRKGALGKWQGRNSGMEIRQLLLETLAEDDEADYDALTSGADDGQAAAAGSRVVERYRRDRGAVRMEELWEESNGVHDE